MFLFYLRIIIHICPTFVYISYRYSGVAVLTVYSRVGLMITTDFKKYVHVYIYMYVYVRVKIN